MKGTWGSLWFLSGLLFGMSATSLLVSHFWPQSRSLGNDDGENSSSELHLLQRVTECSEQLEHLQSPRRSQVPSAAICTIQKGGLYYIDEWVDYHLAIGFEQIFVYDNSEDFELKDWASSRNPNQVVVYDYPQGGQRAAYWDCISRIRNRRSHDWIAFIDLDEFIVLKKHASILELLNDIVVPNKQAGGLALNRYSYVFDSNDHTTHRYEPLPLTKRFQMRWPVEKQWIKTIARTMDIAKPDVHRHNFKWNKTPVDTKGNRIAGHLIEDDSTTDIAVIHHYYTKSIDEFLSRCNHGRATTKNVTTHIPCWPRERAIEHIENITRAHGGATFDNTAWQLLKKNVPAYGRYGP